MAHNDGPLSKTIKLTQEEAIKVQKFIENESLVAGSKGKTWRQHITISI